MDLRSIFKQVISGRVLKAGAFDALIDPAVYVAGQAAGVDMDERLTRARNENDYAVLGIKVGTWALMGVAAIGLAVAFPAAPLLGVIVAGAVAGKAIAWASDKLIETIDERREAARQEKAALVTTLASRQQTATYVALADQVPKQAADQGNVAPTDVTKTNAPESQRVPRQSGPAALT